MDVSPETPHDAYRGQGSEINQADQTLASYRNLGRALGVCFGWSRGQHRHARHARDARDTRVLECKERGGMITGDEGLEGLTRGLDQGLFPLRVQISSSARRKAQNNSRLTWSLFPLRLPLVPLGLYQVRLCSSSPPPSFRCDRSFIDLV